MSELDKKLQIIEDRMKERLSSTKDAKLFRTLMETLIDIREAFEEFNQFFKIDINIDKLEAFQPKEIEYSGEWASSLIKICEVLINLYEKIGKDQLAEKWRKKLDDLQEIKK
ncbi:MAG: hypothetical protein EAX90_02630 [Candidatus Heimdallarchaeota archaeon]|nr:hypothetical protein [Candidatus Heimdallarchaeota archaeon]